MGRFVGATIVIVGAAPSASMQNLVGAGSSWIRLRRSTNSLFQMRSLILGDTKESTGFPSVVKHVVFDTLINIVWFKVPTSYFVHLLIETSSFQWYNCFYGRHCHTFVICI